MHDKVIALYNVGRLTNTGLARAVHYGWITAAEYEELTGEPYVEPVDETADMQNALNTLGVNPNG